jgi:RNA polymerase subunit RPABC4/transcription elongation factor Spt4
MKKKEKPATKICKHCKSEIPYGAKVCPHCRKKQKGGKLKWIILILIVVVAAILIFGGGNSYKLSDDATNMSEKDFKAACEKIKYKDLARSADKYEGTKVKFTGQIQQVVVDSESGESEYLISVTKDEYDIYSDNVYVYFDNSNSESKYIDDDIVTFYGEASGEEEYTSVLGESIKIPAVTAVYMDLKK